MKKLLLIAAALLLVGCTDANANLSDSSTTIFTVGNDTVTKGDVYELLVGRDAGYTVISVATKFILDQEAPVTDAMRTAADETLATFESLYGDTLLSVVQSGGFADIDDFYENNLLATEQLSELSRKYVDINFDTLVETHRPKKVRVFTFADEASAISAKTALESGTSAAEVVETYASESDGSETLVTTSSSLDTAVLAYISEATEAEVSEVMMGASVESYFVVQVVEADAEAMREEVIETLIALSDVSTSSDLYYFDQYKFRIYDQAVYDLIEINYPDYIMQ
ncbi:MAG: hypothetical protein ACK5LZ_03790 [Anaerorhabdus sp.]